MKLNHQIPFSKLTFERKITVYFILVVLVIISIILLSINVTRKYKASTDWVNHTEQVLSLSDSILSSQKDIIIGTRGFIISGDEIFLKNFNQASNFYDSGINRIKELVKDNPPQIIKLDSIQKYYLQYLNVRSRSINYRKDKNFNLSDERPLIDSSENILNTIRLLFSQIQSEEKKLLKKRKDDLKSNTAITVWALRGLLLFFVISIFFAFLIVYRNTRKRNRVEEQIKMLNNDLESIIKEKTDKIIEQETKYRFLLENMREGIQIIGFDWRYIFVNNSVVLQGKYSNEELLGHTMMEKYPGIENTELFNVLRICMRDRVSQKLENEFTYPDQSKGWFELSIQPVPEGLFILSMDITERKIAEESIKESEEKRRLIMNAAIDAIICIDTSGIINFWNPQAEKIFGWNNEEVIGRPLADLIIPEIYRDRHKKGMENYIATGKGRVMNTLMELSALHKTGKEFPVEITILPIKRMDEEFFCAFIRDISIRKQSEIIMTQLNKSLEERAEALQRSNIELEHFAYVASHDLQEPLRMVTSFMSLLEKKLNGQLDESAKKYMHFAVDGAERMKTLIQDLLRYSRLGTSNEKLSKIDLNDVVSDVLRVFEPVIDQNKAKVQIENLPTIICNKTQINQLFQNLLGNALKYRREENPEIEIGCKDQKEEWLFYIKDNGIGIEPKYFEKVFIIFQRLHNKNDYKGTGIGLAICKKIVERHGGKIWIESKFDIGTTFYFTLKKEHHA